MLKARQAYATIRFMLPTITDPPRYVFVYGTLRRGESNDINRLAPAPVFVGKAKINGLLYDLGMYPGMRLGGPDWVQGEVYRTTLKLEQRLDEIESILPHPTGEYIRREWMVQCQNELLLCLVYEIAEARVAGKPLISNGDWVQRKKDD